MVSGPSSSIRNLSADSGDGSLDGPDTRDLGVGEVLPEPYAPGNEERGGVRRNPAGAQRRALLSCVPRRLGGRAGERVEPAATGRRPGPVAATRVEGPESSCGSHLRRGGGAFGGFPDVSILVAQRKGMSV